MSDDDEIVDGPRAAAQILNRMKPAERERLLHSVASQDPAILKKIKDNLFTFEDIESLTDRSIQRVVNEIEHGDLVVSLKTASDSFKVKLFRNMTERKRQLVEEDLASLPPTRLSDVEEAQQRITLRVDELRTQGQVRSEGDDDDYI